MSGVKHLLLLALAAQAAFAFPNVDSIIPEEELMGTPTDDFDEVNALAYRMLEHIHQNPNDLNLKDPNVDLALEDAQGLDQVSVKTRWGVVKKVTKHVKRAARTVHRAARTVGRHVAKAASHAYRWLKKQMASFCRKGINTAAGKVVKKLFKKAHKVCTKICVKAAGKVVLAGGGSPAGAKAGTLIGAGCGMACYAAKRALQAKMSEHQLTSQCFANWCCNKIGKPLGWPHHADGCASKSSGRRRSSRRRSSRRRSGRRRSWRRRSSRRRRRL